jgi:hypothetical protein
MDYFWPTVAYLLVASIFVDLVKKYYAPPAKLLFASEQKSVNLHSNMWGCMPAPI